MPAPGVGPSCSTPSPRSNSPARRVRDLADPPAGRGVQGQTRVGHCATDFGGATTLVQYLWIGPDSVRLLDRAYDNGAHQRWGSPGRVTSTCARGCGAGSSRAVRQGPPCLPPTRTCRSGCWPVPLQIHQDGEADRAKQQARYQVERALDAAEQVLGAGRERLQARALNQTRESRNSSRISNPRVRPSTWGVTMAASSPMKNSIALGLSRLVASPLFTPCASPAARLPARSARSPLPARPLSAPPAQPAQIEGTHQFHGEKEPGLACDQQADAGQAQGGVEQDGEGDAKGRSEGGGPVQAGAQDEREIRARLARATRWTRPRVRNRLVNIKDLRQRYGGDSMGQDGDGRL